MKKILSVTGAPRMHWVGDGFPVHGMFGYNGEGVAERSPFLMLDFAPSYGFKPNTGYRRGVGAHPHRGFETVTIVFEGEVEHRDNTGAGGIIGPGDVQWMTAGAGIIHEEFHSPAFSASGGNFSVAQLWVNLPASAKSAPAGYQGLTSGDIPVVSFEGGTARVVAGEFKDSKGPARTFTPMNVLDVKLSAGSTYDFAQPEGWSTIVVMMSGTGEINGTQILRAAEVATLSTEGSTLSIEAGSDAHFLVLSGEPIDEPVVGYGPFVMNTQAEIIQAVADFNSGKFGAPPR